MAAEFKCDICGKQVKHRKVVKFLDLSDICEYCEEGFKMVIDLMKYGPFVEDVRGFHQKIFRKK